MPSLLLRVRLRPPKKDYRPSALPAWLRLAKNSLGEMAMATPARVGESVIVRTAAALYRIGK
jgi:hypothetical protein